MFYDKLFDYAISLYLNSKSLNATFGALIFSGVKDLRLAALLKPDSFHRISSRIDVSMCYGISQGLLHVLSFMFFDNLFAFEFVSTHYWKGHQKVCYRYVGPVISLSRVQFLFSVSREITLR